MSQIFEKFANLGENHSSSRTLHIETANLENRTGRQPSPSTTSPSTHIKPRVRGEDPDRLSQRQSASQFSGKFADLGENRDSSRTLHVGATNSGSHTNRQFLPVAIPPFTVTSSTAAESHIHGKDLECLPIQQHVSQTFGKFANLSGNHNNSRTPNIGAKNLESHTNRQSLNISAPFPEPLLRDL